MTDSLASIEPIHTDRCELRPLHLLDVDSVQAITDDPTITGLIDFLPNPFTRADAEWLVHQADNGSDCFFGLWVRETGALAGVIGTHLRADPNLEVGYWIAKEYRGRGYATEGVRGLVIGLAERFPERRIYAECRPENVASWRVLEKIGFRPTHRPGARRGRERLEWA